MESFIKAIGATYKYKDGFGLEPIDLEIYKEDIAFIVGANGCGKSTLSKLLCGITKPCLGQVLVDNVDTKGLSLSEIGKKIGYVWQNVDLQLFCIKAWDELIFKYKLEDRLTIEVENKAKMMLKALHIEHIKDSNIDCISKGERQRLALAIMLMNENNFFILDEPTVGLDCDCKELLANIIINMNINNHGFLIISHDEDFVHRLATRIIYMKKGGIEYDERL